MPEQEQRKKEQLEQIKADILKSNICSNLAQDATQLVMGQGSFEAKIVFIGEAPGKQEDLQGIPFVGSAGKLLDEMLASIGLDRASVYITNIVKYRPPNNRDPLPDEKQVFWPFLLRELKVIDPQLVVCLGRHSMGYFLPNARITEAHGKVGRAILGDKEVKVLPLYHPAAALYNGGLRQTLFNDFKNIKQIIL